LDFSSLKTEVIAAPLSGGTVVHLVGGKFTNGAITVVFARFFKNAC